MDEVGLKRLRWRCRRGMRELDVLLTGFLERRFAALDSDQQASFVRLLECQDPDLLDWLTGRRSDYPPDCAVAIGLLVDVDR
jgi:antitoxin CptB